MRPLSMPISPIISRGRSSVSRRPSRSYSRVEFPSAARPMPMTCWVHTGSSRVETRWGSARPIRAGISMTSSRLSGAAFMMFLVSEVHPFTDGNGRMARIMTNAELIAGGEHRIIIPTVFREDYLLALRALTRQGHTDPFLRMLDRAQDFVSRIDFHDLDHALEILRGANAFSDPSEARLILPSA